MVRAVLDETLVVVGKEQLSYWGFVAELLAECDDGYGRFSQAGGFTRAAIGAGTHELLACSAGLGLVTCRSSEPGQVVPHFL